MAEKSSWKWKLILGLIAAVVVGFLITLTPWGQDWIKGRIDAAYEEIPDQERRTEETVANRFLTLAWFKAYICQDSKGAMEMYKEFLGLQKDKQGQDFFTTGRLTGKVSPDGKTGWGPLHPRAPDAFWEYANMYDVASSDQMAGLEYKKYYYLFYDYPQTHSGKPHPAFNKYWPRIKDRMMMKRAPLGDIDPNAPYADRYEGDDAPPPDEKK